MWQIKLNSGFERNIQVYDVSLVSLFLNIFFVILLQERYR